MQIPVDFPIFYKEGSTMQVNAAITIASSGDILNNNGIITIANDITLGFILQYEEVVDSQALCWSLTIHKHKSQIASLPLMTTTGGGLELDYNVIRNLGYQYPCIEDDFEKIAKHLADLASVTIYREQDEDIVEDGTVTVHQITALVEIAIPGKGGAIFESISPVPEDKGNLFVFVQKSREEIDDLLAKSVSDSLESLDLEEHLE
jgi:hypothetical protein